MKQHLDKPLHARFTAINVADTTNIKRLHHAPNPVRNTLIGVFNAVLYTGIIWAALWLFFAATP
tara:strand:+ start:810 stop:1001 length:192 start_codon:yes stop_codon:yes gene_type:complete